jgi:hypothetical protein
MTTAPLLSRTKSGRGGGGGGSYHSYLLAVLTALAVAHTYIVIRDRAGSRTSWSRSGSGEERRAEESPAVVDLPEPIVHMVTFSNRLRKEECHSFRSLWMAGAPIHAIGIDGSYLGTQWWEAMRQKADPGGTIMKKLKVFATYDYLQTLPPHALVVFNDASDVIYSPHWMEPKDSSSSPSSWQDRLWSTVQSIHRAHGTDPRVTTLFGAERTCWPFFINGAPRMENAAKICNSYPQSPSTYRYLNSGNWIAFRDPALQLLARWKHDLEFRAGIQSDQHAAAYLYVNQTSPIVLDFQHEIFGNDAFPLMKSRELSIDYETGIFTNLETDQNPLILHFNGGKLGFDETAQRLYDDSQRQNWSDTRTAAFSSAMKESIRLSGGKLLECNALLKME